MKEKRIAFIFGLPTQREKSNRLGVITVELRLEFEIAESGVTINAIAGGFAQATSQIDTAILEAVLQAVEQRAIEAMMQNEPGRYRRNGRQSQPRHLKSRLREIRYRMAQVRDEQGAV